MRLINCIIHEAKQLKIWLYKLLAMTLNKGTFMYSFWVWIQPVYLATFNNDSAMPFHCTEQLHSLHTWDPCS